MAQEAAWLRHCREGIQPFLESDETLRYFTLGTNKATLGAEILVGAVMGGIVGGVIGDSITGRGKKVFIVGLTDRRLILVEVSKWKFFGGVKQTGDVQLVALADIKNVQYKKQGPFQGALTVETSVGKMTLAFEKLPVVTRATEMFGMLQFDDTLRQWKVNPTPVAPARVSWFWFSIGCASTLLGVFSALIGMAESNSDSGGAVICGFIFVLVGAYVMWRYFPFSKKKFA